MHGRRWPVLSYHLIVSLLAVARPLPSRDLTSSGVGARSARVARSTVSPRTWVRVQRADGYKGILPCRQALHFGGMPPVGCISAPRTRGWSGLIIRAQTLLLPLPRACGGSPVFRWSGQCLGRGRAVDPCTRARDRPSVRPPTSTMYAAVIYHACGRLNAPLVRSSVHAPGCARIEITRVSIDIQDAVVYKRHPIV